VFLMSVIKNVSIVRFRSYRKRPDIVFRVKVAQVQFLEAKMPTHEVFNQSPVFENVNFYSGDKALVQAVRAYDNDEGLAAFGEITGSAIALEHGRLANVHKPELVQFDTKGFRCDKIEFHPSYHELMSISARQGLHNAVWQEKPQSNVKRAAGLYLAAQMEPAHCCPITMTNACVPTIAKQDDLAKIWLPKVLANDYDPAFAPLEQKRAVTIGMGMTEKQGGTDVRANTTIAKPVGNAEYRLTGHKWFMSAPMCDAFLVLAQAPGGLSCFLLPRFTPDGQQNRVYIQRLKNKLGNRANASSEVEFDNTAAFLIGNEGEGVRNIIEMVTMTRLDCVVSSAALMRQAIAQVINHVQHRTVFQKKLFDQPLMRQVIADMVLDHEAATALAFRLAHAFDRQENSRFDKLYMRFMTPVIKYHVCKGLPAIAYEAMECMGGNGYVEDGPLARLYREAPLNAIWEGSGNVMCLDFLRALGRDPQGFAELLQGFDGGKAVDQEKQWIGERLARPAGIEADARMIIERLAHMAAASILTDKTPDFIAENYTTTRITGRYHKQYGATGLDQIDKIIDRARP
jgi:putative acyl-CoA dehydrogenase